MQSEPAGPAGTVRPELFGRNRSASGAGPDSNGRGQPRSKPLAVRQSCPGNLSEKIRPKESSEKAGPADVSGRFIRKTYPEKPSGKTGQADASGRRIRPGRSANSSGPGRSADPVSKAGRKAIPSKSLSFPLPVPFPESGRAAVQVQAVPGAPLPVSVPVFQARSPEIRPTGQSVPDAVQI